MMVKLHADLVEMVWVIMAYILISTVFLLTFGRVADMLGRVRMYNLALWSSRSVPPCAASRRTPPS